MAKLNTYRQRDYSGGLNDTADPSEIKRNEASLLRNWDITYQGQLLRRKGLTLVGGAEDIGDTPITGLGAYLRDGGKDLLAFADDTLYYLNSTTWTQLDNGFTPGDLWFENVQVKGKIYFGNEDNVTHVWDRGATVGTIGSTTQTGNGLDDGTFGGSYVGGGQTYRVQIDGTGTPDTFKWSDDGGSTWEEEDIAITGAAQTLSNGVTITFGATTGHTSGDYWEASPTSAITELNADDPHGNVYRWHKNHMFTLNNVNVSGTKYPHRIYWSDFGDPETYTESTSFFEVPGNGRCITMCDLGDYLVIFKERAIQFLEGWGSSSWAVSASTSNVANIDEQVGCIAPRGVTRVGDEIWFVDNEGQIRRLYLNVNDAFRRSIVSSKIQGTLATVNTAQLEKTVAWTAGDKVYFAFASGSSTTPDLVCVYDLIASQRTKEEAWTTYTGWDVGLFASYPTSVVPDLLIGDATTGLVYKHDGDDDNGVAIDARWDGKDDEYDEEEKFKRYKFGYITAETSSGSASIEVHASVNRAPFAKVGTIDPEATGSRLGPTGSFLLGPTGDARLGGGSTAEEKFYYSAGGGSPRGKSVMHSVRHKQTGVQPSVNGFSSHWKLRTLR